MSPVKQGPTMKLLFHLKEQLITPEDPIHVHKVLGILVLCSYAWRFSKIGAADMRFATQPEWTIPTLILHVCLNLSSFEFYIPNKRIRDGGRIWPEYRWHAFIFLMRSVGSIAVNWYEHHYYAGNPLPPNYHCNFLLVLAAMVAADIASNSVAHRSSSIRELQASPAAKYYFSCIQFLSTAMILFGDRRNSIHYYMMFVLQLTPLLMTLRRKNLVPHSVNVFIYGCFLAGGLILPRLERSQRPANDLTMYVVRLVGCMAALWRMGPWPAWFSICRNKYLMWATMHFVVLQRLLRPVMEKSPDALLQPFHVKVWSHCMLLGLVGLGIYKYYVPKSQKVE